MNNALLGTYAIIYRYVSIKTIIIVRRGFVPSRFYPNLLVWDSVTQYEYTYRYLP